VDPGISGNNLSSRAPWSILQAFLPSWMPLTASTIAELASPANRVKLSKQWRKLFREAFRRLLKSLCNQQVWCSDRSNPSPPARNTHSRTFLWPLRLSMTKDGELLERTLWADWKLTKETWFDSNF